MRAIVEGDLFLSARSSFFFLSFFSHSESCSKIQFFKEKRCFRGGPGERRKEMKKEKNRFFFFKKKNKKNENMKKRTQKMKK